MGGYVTQTRVSPNFELKKGEWYPTPGAQPVVSDPFNGSGSLRAPSQVTTSYRSGRTELAEDPWNIPESSNALRRQLRDEHRRKGSGTSDTGHTFDTVKESLTLSPSRFELPHVGSSAVAYRGALWLPPSNVYTMSGDVGPWRKVDPVDLGWYGTRAVNITKPLSPVADLATTLAELKREGFPSLKSSAMNSQGGGRIQGIGSDHLNMEFGLKPLASELGNVAAATTQAKSLLQQIERDAGRIVRRGYTFPEETLSSGRSGGNSVGFAVPAGVPSASFNSLFWNLAPAGRHYQTDHTTRRIWFRGAYSYHWPEGKTFMGKLDEYERKLNALYGTRVTPAVLWNLAPWSWFGDWFGNIGDILENASALASDGLVMRYGYLMCETTHVRTITISGVRLRSGVTLPPLIQTYTTVRKQRVKATPYGFGLSPDSLTNRQWGILAALGMTKTPRSLR